VRREGGFVGIDVVLFLLMFLSSSTRQSLKRFGQWSEPHRRELAALGARRKFATPSSVSRFQCSSRTGRSRGDELAAHDRL
jgi:hypothetical protein